MLNLLILFAYLEHMVIFWCYSLWWSIKDINNTKNIVYPSYIPSLPYFPHTLDDAKQVAKYSLKVQLFILPPIGLLFSYFYSNLDREYVLSRPEFSYQELIQWIFMFVWQDSLFYWIHRTLHLPRFYHLHKLHHSWKFPVPWEALYASKTENAILNFFPTLSAPLIAGLKIHYLYVWIAIATFASLISHSRFKSVSSHSLHHRYFNVNYGTTNALDVLFGTSWTYPLNV